MVNKVGNTFLFLLTIVSRDFPLGSNRTIYIVYMPDGHKCGNIIKLITPVNCLRLRDRSKHFRSPEVLQVIDKYQTATNNTN